MQLTGIEVWDGDRPLGVCDVSWDDGVFTAVRSPAEPGVVPAAEPAIEPAAEPAAGREGLALLPGLIDTHVHLLGNAGRQADPPADDFYTWKLTTTREEQVLHGLAQARRALRVGVTTVRDLGADTRQVALARALDAGVIEGPRIITHGMVSMTAGHEDLFTPSAVVDRPPTADGADGCRRAVRVFARNGLDGIKIATSGGVLSMGDRNAWRNHTDDEIAAIVDEAHALGMRVAAHAHTAEGVERALAHGVDSLEHATSITAEQADLAAARGVTIAPTLLINDRIASGAVATPPGSRVKAVELVARRDLLFADAAARGASFVLGTDANGFHVRFGDELEELRRMAEVLGLSAPDVLRAATSRAAATVGRAASLGRIAVGFAADAVVVRGRPWDDVAALDVGNVVAVISRGAVVYGTLG